MSSSLNHRDIDTTACRPGPVEPFWEGRSSVPCATNAAEFSVSRPCRGWGVADTKSTGGQIWLDMPELPCPECQDWGRAWGLNRLKLWIKAEQMPVQGRVWFRRETEHVTCSVQLGGPWFGTGELPVTAVHAPERDPAPSPRQFPLAVPRDTRLEPAAHFPCR